MKREDQDRWRKDLLALLAASSVVASGALAVVAATAHPAAWVRVVVAVDVLVAAMSAFALVALGLRLGPFALDPPPPSPPPPSRRALLPETPASLMEIHYCHTKDEAEALLGPKEGGWLQVSGSFEDRRLEAEDQVGDGGPCGLLAWVSYNGAASSVSCWFNSEGEDAKYIQRLSRGAPLTVTGRFREVDLGVILTECEIDHAL